MRSESKIVRFVAVLDFPQHSREIQEDLLLQQQGIAQYAQMTSEQNRVTEKNLLLLETQRLEQSVTIGRHKSEVERLRRLVSKGSTQIAFMRMLVLKT